MNGTPLVNTTAAGISSIQVGQLVAWIAGSLGLQMPDNIAFTIGVGIIVAGHALYKVLAPRWNLKADPDSYAPPNTGDVSRAAPAQA
jgi:hypothetical protein